MPYETRPNTNILLSGRGVGGQATSAYAQGLQAKRQRMQNTMAERAEGDAKKYEAAHKAAMAGGEFDAQAMAAELERQGLVGVAQQFRSNYRQSVVELNKYVRDNLSMVTGPESYETFRADAIRQGMPPQFLPPKFDARMVNYVLGRLEKEAHKWETIYDKHGNRINVNKTTGEEKKIASAPGTTEAGAKTAQQKNIEALVDATGISEDEAARHIFKLDKNEPLKLFTEVYKANARGWDADPETALQMALEAVREAYGVEGMKKIPGQGDKPADNDPLGIR